MTKPINKSGERKPKGDKKQISLWAQNLEFNERGANRQSEDPRIKLYRRGVPKEHIQDEFSNLGDPDEQFDWEHMKLKRDLSRQTLKKPDSEVPHHPVGFFKARMKRPHSLFTELVSQQMSRIDYMALPIDVLPQTPIDILAQEQLNIDYTPKHLPSSASIVPNIDDTKPFPYINLKKHLMFLPSELIPIVRLKEKGFSFNQIAKIGHLDDYQPEYGYTQALKMANSIDDNLSRLPEVQHLLNKQQYSLLSDIEQYGYKPENHQNLGITELQYRQQSQQLIIQLRSNLLAKIGDLGTS